MVPHRLALLAETHALPDGNRVRLRLTRPSDADLVHDFLERVAASSELRVRHLTFYDPRRRLVLAATLPVDGRECIVGMVDAAFHRGGERTVEVLTPAEPRDEALEELLRSAGDSLAERHAAA